MRVSTLLALIALGVLLAADEVHAQARHVEHTAAPAIVCELSATEFSPGSRSASRPAPRGASHVVAGSIFEVTYSGFSSEAQSAFQAAVDVWEQHITSSERIRISANWIPLDGNILGSAGPYLVRNFDAAPIPNTWYPAPLANALAGLDLDPSTPEIEATFNSDFANWYFGTDGAPPQGTYDLTTIVLHEIGHGLGFIGAFKIEKGRGTVGVESNPGIPFVYDRFSEDEMGRPLLDASTYPLNSTALADALQTATFLGSGSVEATNGAPARLYSPRQWNEGSSYSHLDEDDFPRDDEDGLMTPFLRSGEVIRSPGPLACASLKDIGWTLAPPCANLIEEASPPQPISGGYNLRVDGSNPFVGETSVLVAVEQSQTLKFRLVDRIGRTVMRQDRFIQAGGTASILIDGRELPAGVYFVQVVGETFTGSRAVTKVR